MTDQWRIDLKFLEQGDIYFFYKPKRGIAKTESFEDVSRFFMVLVESKKQIPRYIVMGNKKLPMVNDGGKSSWGLVQTVGGRGFKTKIKQPKTPPKGSSRPAGEGIYAIVAHRNHIHFMYSLELPEKIGQVQKAFNIHKQGNYIFLSRDKNTDPVSSSKPFSNFSPVNINDLYERQTQILLVGINDDIGSTGIEAQPTKETLLSSDILRKLQLNPNRHYINSLIKGTWI